jgi:autotransporter-associated beta strand protein
MKITFHQRHLVVLLAVLFGLTQLAGAAGTTVWTGADNTVSTNWSDTLNWSPGPGAANPPGTSDTVVFKSSGGSGVTVVDNVVDTPTTIASLLYTNVGAATTAHNTLLLSNLTVNGLVSVGFVGQTTPDAMSGTGNFTVNNTSGAFNIGGSSGSTETATLTLADGTNTINVSKLSIGESAGNNGRQCTLNLGNGVNLINADNINAGTGKAQGTIQFAAAATNGSIVIRNAAGTGRASIVLGNSSSSGSATTRGSLLLAGHRADVLAGLLEISGTNGSAGTGGSTGTNTFDNGTLDVTSIHIGENSPGNNTHPTSIGILTVGGDPTNTATLSVNSPLGPGGGGFIVSGALGPWTNDNGVFLTILTGAGTFNLNTNGIARIYTSITESAPTNNTGTINVTGGTLIMEAATNTIGTPSIPIDNVTLDFATLQFSEDGSSLNAAVRALTLNDTNVVNIAALPPIVHLPTKFPIITYTSLGSSFNLGLGTLPGDYHGYVTNDGVSTISLVITSGTVVPAKQDLWTGAVNTNWDTATLNWTNAGVAVAYAEGDFVTFDDTAKTGTVNLVGNQHAPSSLTVTNNSRNYALSGPGRISGATSLIKHGSASLALAESGGDNFAGGILVHGGTVVLDDPNSNISGGLTNDPGTVVQIGNNDANGTLPSGNLDIEGTLAFNRTDNFLLSIGIPGGGGLTQNGSGTLTLSAANSYSGNTTVANGTLALNGGGSVVSPLTFVKNATLDVSGTGGSVTLSALALTNGICNLGVVPTSLSSLGMSNSTLSLVATIGGSANIVAPTLVTGGTTNVIKVTSVLNLTDPPTLPTIVPLVSYTSATFIGGFNFGLIPPPGIKGFISNDVANSSVDLVITVAPQSITWNGGSSTGNNWSDAANWSGTPIDALDPLFFDGSVRVNNTNDTPAGTTYTNITFNGTAGAFTLNGNSVNLGGTLLNNSSVTQAVNLGFIVNGSPTFDGGFSAGALAISGGVTNVSTTASTVNLQNMGTLSDLWATNNGANGGGQLRFVIGTVGGTWTILDGTGSGALIPVGNLQLAINAGGAGAEFDFGTVSSAPNVDGGTGSIDVNGSSSLSIDTFNINNGTLRVRGMTIPGSGSGHVNVNGGTLVLGTNSFLGGGGAGGAILTAALNSGAIYSTNGGIFQVTARCPAMFTMNGGLLQCGTLEVSAGTAASGNGIFNLDGGRLICSGITCGLVAGNASSTMNFNGGTLQANASSTSFISQNNLAPLSLNVSTNGAFIDTTNFNDTISFPLSHDPGLDVVQPTPDGGLTKLGAGTLTLSGVNTYTGPSAVTKGTLQVSGSLVSDVNVAANGTLAGTGSVGGQVMVTGTIAPGTNAATGTLTVSSNVTINSGGTNVMKLNKTGATNDVLSVSGTLTYGGTLSLTNLSGTLAAGNSFKLFSAGTYSGSFAHVLPATPGAGLGWGTSTLNTDGTLRVVATTPSNITAIFSGNQLHLSWPADHIGWRLQSQTNSLSTGLGTNWADVVGSGAVNSISVTVNPANGTVFYRMAFP